MFWPISNTLTFFFGVKVITTRQLMGWKRFVPLIVGLRLPFSIVSSVMTGMSYAVLIVSGIFAAISWAILGYVAYTSPASDKLRYVPVVI